MAFFFIVLLIEGKNNPVIQPGTLAFDFPTSLQSFLREENGESKTKQDIPLTSEATYNCVHAPIDLPHKIISYIPKLSLIYLIAAFISSFSKIPNETYSPSDSPEPDMSKANI